MIPVTVVQPKKLSGVWSAARAAKGGFKFLAGGTDLVINARHGKNARRVWIDISRLKELKGITEGRGKIRIGAAETVAAVCSSPAVRKWLPALAQACRHFASPPLRNMATLGGNCANASPSADAACALCAEQAAAVISRAGKIRRVAAESLFLGPKHTALRPDDLILAFEFPRRAHRGVFAKLGARESFAISKVSAAVAAELRNGVVCSLSIRLGAVGPKIVRPESAEKLLLGLRPGAAAIADAARLCAVAVSPIDDVRSTAAYRRDMARVISKRALEAGLLKTSYSYCVINTTKATGLHFSHETHEIHEK